MRELYRQRFFVVDTASDFKCKIIALLDQTMLSVNTQTLTDLLLKTSHRRFGLDKAKQIQQRAKNLFGIINAPKVKTILITHILLLFEET